MVERKEHHGKEVKHDRHTSKHEHGQSYGVDSAKGGAGKYNWGAGGSTSQDVPTSTTLDRSDPMYDSDSERKAAAAAAAAAPANPTSGPTDEKPAQKKETEKKH